MLRGGAVGAVCERQWAGVECSAQFSGGDRSSAGVTGEGPSEGWHLRARTEVGKCAMLQGAGGSASQVLEEQVECLESGIWGDRSGG